MTLFERIIIRELPAEILFEDDRCIAIRDKFPQAPVHLLVIPKKLIPRLAEASVEDEALLGHLLLTAQTLGAKMASGGFRIAINNGHDAGETVPHLHVHVLGGRALNWPPG